MKVAGITRVRNVADIITDTLNHVAQYVDEIHVYDDASNDATVEVCMNHYAVVKVIENPNLWTSNPRGRASAEGYMRQAAVDSARKSGADWVYCFDADEFIDPLDLDFEGHGYYFRLFDFYITPEDVNGHYLDRKWLGPEYREIPMIFRLYNDLRFTQRVPRNWNMRPLKFGGYVRHYGKAISVEEWERKCEYYANIRWKDRQPELRKTWQNRVGKAIHTHSDYGRDLIEWKDVKDESKIVKIAWANN